MEFNGIKYEVLYSNQLTKKNKTWKDGYMTYFPKGSKAYLYDESNKHIDSIYAIRTEPVIDEELKFDKYIVLPQAILQNSSNINHTIEQNNKNENINENENENKNEIENENEYENVNDKIFSNKIPILKKSIKKKNNINNNKLFTKTRSISQLLSLFPSIQKSNIPFQKNENTPKNNDLDLMSLNTQEIIDKEKNILHNMDIDKISNIPKSNINVNNTIFNHNNKYDNIDKSENNYPKLNKSNIIVNNDMSNLEDFDSLKDVNQNIVQYNNTKNLVSYLKETNKNLINNNNNINKYNSISNSKNFINQINLNTSSINNSSNILNNNNKNDKYINEPKHLLKNINSNNNSSIKTIHDNSKLKKEKEKENIKNNQSIRELYFPSAEEYLDINDSNLIRKSIIPINFMNVSEYQLLFKNAILENIQIELFKLAIKYRSLPFLNEPSYRSNGINFYSDCVLTRFQPVFLKYKKKNNNCNYLLSIARKEKSSSYSKDDIWIISLNKTFEKNTTFLAKSVFYGPNGNSAIEVEPIGKNDIEISKYITINKKPIFNVFAIRALNINTEEIIMTNLRLNITKSSILPYLLNFNNTIKKKSNNKRFNSPSMMSLINEKKINEFNEFLDDIIIQYKLNEDQEIVLRSFIDSLKNSSKSPITLVHGVFGAGKSLLISIVIFFLYRSYISGFINSKTNFKILVSSMTNVAVDRILLYLMEKFDFKNFVRVGSLKKISKPLLPYAAQISKGNEDIDELNSLLKCDDLSPTEIKCIQDTIKKFKKNENRNNIHHSFLIATTCIASSFEILDHIKVPIVILDECSQFIEPLSLLPICRFQSEKLLLVGDPKQLSPTITTNSAYEKDPVNKGLDRTLFERLALSQCTPIMLRTQYRVILL